MTKKRKSSQSGVLNGVTTDTQRGTPSSGVVLTPLAGNQSTLDTSDSTVPKNPTFQPTPNSLAVPPRVAHAKIITAFASKLGALVEWRKVRLGDGREGYALFFDNNKWLVDPLTKELTPLGE